MTKDFVLPAGGNPQIGNLETPINSWEPVKNFIKNLPIYRSGLDAQRRGLEIGMAHGYLLFGPFAKLGPLRDSQVPNLAGFLAASGLVAILTACLWIYAQAVFTKKQEGQSSLVISTIPTVTAPGVPLTVPQLPADLSNRAGWETFTLRFLVGGLGGAFVGYLVMMVVSLLF